MKKIAAAASFMILSAMGSPPAKAGDLISEQDFQRAADAAYTQFDFIKSGRNERALERLSTNCYASLGNFTDDVLPQAQVAYCIDIDLIGMKLTPSAFFSHDAAADRMRLSFRRSVAAADASAFMDRVGRTLDNTYVMIDTAGRLAPSTSSLTLAADAVQTQIKLTMMSTGLIGLHNFSSGCYAALKQKPTRNEVSYCILIDVMSAPWASALGDPPDYFKRATSDRRINAAVTRAIPPKERAIFMLDLNRAWDEAARMLENAKHF